MNIIQSDIKTMSSREIAELTGKEHSNVKRDISAMVLQLNYPDKLLKDCPVFDPSELKGHGIELSSFEHCGNTYDNFLMDQEYSLLLVSGYKVSLRQSIIKRWQELESADQTPAAALPDFSNPAAAARAWAEQYEISTAAQEQLQLAAPKVEYHDKVLSSSNGLLTTEIAADFNMSAIKLNRLLKDLKVQRKVGGRWVLTAAMLGKNYTTEDTFIDENGKSRHSMRWTELGRKLIHELIEGVE